jgi:hypothetical protein
LRDFCGIWWGRRAVVSLLDACPMVVMANTQEEEEKGEVRFKNAGRIFANTFQ